MSVTLPISAWRAAAPEENRATKANPVVITSTAHGFANDDIVYITGVKGMTQLNNKAYTVRNRAANTFQLLTARSSSPAYVDRHPRQGRRSQLRNLYVGGRHRLRKDGCQVHTFPTRPGPTHIRGLRNSTCVAERTGSDAYTDTAPSGTTALVGTNYPSMATVARRTDPAADDRQRVGPETDRGARRLADRPRVSSAPRWAWYTLSPNLDRFGRQAYPSTL